MVITFLPLSFAALVSFFALDILHFIYNNYYIRETGGPREKRYNPITITLGSLVNDYEELELILGYKMTVIFIIL